MLRIVLSVIAVLFILVSPGIHEQYELSDAPDREGLRLLEEAEESKSAPSFYLSLESIRNFMIEQGYDLEKLYEFSWITYFRAKALELGNADMESIEYLNLLSEFRRKSWNGWVTSHSGMDMATLLLPVAILLLLYAIYPAFTPSNTEKKKREQ